MSAFSLFMEQRKLNVDFDSLDASQKRGVMHQGVKDWKQLWWLMEHSFGALDEKM